MRRRRRKDAPESHGGDPHWGIKQEIREMMPPGTLAIERHELLIDDPDAFRMRLPEKHFLILELLLDSYQKNGWFEAEVFDLAMQTARKMTLRVYFHDYRPFSTGSAVSHIGCVATRWEFHKP